jgi:glycosyltransferase involved in cell wall biosynthesis
MRILHVEVGGDYGGSVRALEVYLARSARADFEHDVLFYRRTPGAERLEQLARRVRCLQPGSLRGGRGRATGGRVRALVRKALSTGVVAEARDWLDLLRRSPLAWRLRGLMREGGYDLVHVNNTLTYQGPTLLAARLAGIPVVSHGRNPVRGGVFARSMMRLSDSVVTDSDSLREVLGSWNTGVPVLACLNCVELPPPAAITSGHAVRAELMPEDGVLIGSVGRLDDQKGYEFFVRAARRVADVHPRARFAIAGDGPRRFALEKLIADLGLQACFRLCGFRSDVTSFIAALDLFVSSSRWEGLPLVLLEALLQGKPVVVTDVGGNREVVRPGRTGLIVPPEDPEALAAAILEALDGRGASFDPDLARSTAAAVADPRTNADAFDHVLEEVARRSRASRQPVPRTT